MALPLAVLLAGCSSGPVGQGSPQLDRGPVALPEIAVSDEHLDARALTAEASFLFPEETRALVRGLLRTEFARREAERLGLRADQQVLEESLQEAVAGIAGSLEAGEDLESWARTRYDRSWDEVRAVLRRHLHDNQLYQLVLRADAVLEGRVVLHVLTSPDRSLAEGWGRKLRSGADPAVLARESLDPGPRGDAEFPPFAGYLPEPLGSALARAEPGAVIGPFRFAGDAAWRVVRLRERIDPQRHFPTVASLVENLRRHPISALEARAWFEEMLRRYTSAERLPAIRAPASAFVRKETR